MWEYRPSARNDGLLRLWFEIAERLGARLPRQPDGHPRAAAWCCAEDDAGVALVDTHPAAPGVANVNRLIGLTPDGDAFELAVNRLNDAEFAGRELQPGRPDDVLQHLRRLPRHDRARGSAWARG